MRKQLLASASAAALVFGLATGAMAQTEGPETNVNGETSGNVINAGQTDAMNTVTDSGGGATGVTHIQENNGSANILNLGTNVVTVDGPQANDPVRSKALVGQGSDGLTSDGNHIGSAGGTRSNEISSSYDNNASGVTGVQQNDGHANAMGVSNAVAGVTNTPTDDGPDLTQEASSSGTTRENSGPDSSDVNDALAIDADQDRDNDVLSGSFNTYSGVAAVQQNNGDGNVIGASTAVAGFSSNGGDRDVSVVDQDVTADGIVRESPDEGIVDGAFGSGPGMGDGYLGSDRRNDIDSSYKNMGGIATVQQNNGTANAIMSATAVAGQGPGIAGGTGSIDDARNPGTIDQDVEALGDIGNDDIGTGDDAQAGVTALDEGGKRRNAITSESFRNATGIFTVQENNGDANTVNAATGVAAATDLVNASGPNGGVEQEALAKGNDVEVDERSPSSYAENNPNVDYERANTIRDSLNGNSPGVNGVGTVQQNNGNSNALNVATAVADINSGNTSNSNQQIRGGVTQTVEAGRQGVGNSVESIDTQDLGQGRLNRMTQGTLNNVSGTVTVQQNNGDANTMNVATAVTATLSEVDGGVTQNVRAEDNTPNDDQVGNGQISTISENDYERTNNVNNSFLNADGTANVQQNNGDSNSVNAATAVFGSVFSGGSGPQTGGTINDGLDQNNILARNNVVRDVNGEDPGDTGNLDGGALDIGGKRENLLQNSAFEDVQGTTNVQQNNGNANTMDAATAVAGSRQLNGNGNVNGGVEQETVGGFNNADGINNDIGAANSRSDSGLPSVLAEASDGNDRDNKITGSFDDAAGVHNVQQNNGDANSINTASAVAYVEGDVSGGATQDVDMTGTDLRSIETLDENTTRDNTIGNSFGDTGGLVSVQQNNGNANSLNNATAVLLANDVSGTIDQDVNGDATVHNTVNTTANSVDRGNTVENNAFDGTSGVATLQQNNGDGNYMGTGTAVTSSLGEPVTQVTLNGSVTGSTVNIENDAAAAINNTTNTVSGSFDNVSGVTTVQQNNGNNNVIQSGVTVSANF